MHYSNLRDGLMSKIIFDDLLCRLGVACPLVPYGGLNTLLMLSTL